MKKILSLVLLICFLFSNVSFSVAKSISDEESIKNQIKNYFDLRYSMMSKLVVDESIEKLSDLQDEESNNFLLEEKKVLETNIEHRKIQLSDLKFSKYSYDLTYNKIDINNNSADVDLDESHSIFYNCSPDVESKIAGLNHKIKLKKKNGTWLIARDEYYDDVKDFLKKYLASNSTSGKSSSEVYEDAKQLILKDSLSEINKDKQTAKYHNDTIKKRIDSTSSNKISNPSIASASTTYTFHSYQWLAAKDYARQWALGMNSPPWGNYESPTLGGDCTNFASQAIHQGGVPFDSTGSYTWYWYSDSNRVPSWTGVTYLYSYMMNNNSSSSSNYGIKAHLSYFGGISWGDIVQKTNSSGSWTHTMVVTGYVNNGAQLTDYLISQHSDTSAGRALDYPLSAKTGTKRYIYTDGYYN